MKLIGHHETSLELQAVVAFFRWQKQEPSVVVDKDLSWLLGKSKEPVVALFVDDQLAAVGFWNITRYWSEHFSG